VRSWNIAKYLTRLGWDVVVVTPHPSLCRRLENPDKVATHLEQEGIRRILTHHRWRCLALGQLRCWNQGVGWFVGGICRHIMRRRGIDRGIGWIRAAQQACSTLTAQDVDLILASGPPFAAFRLAKRLADRLGRPYVLDYRDPWTRKPHTPRPARPATIQEEANLLAGCAAVTIVSRSWGVDLEQRFRLGSKLHIVTNGYDPEELVDVEPYSFGHFAIVYAGIFYPPKRVISPVIAALKRLKETAAGRGGEWYFHYYGRDENHVRAEAERFGMTERVVLHGEVSRSEALSAVSGAGVAVVITSVADEAILADKGIVTGKIFETIGLGMPTLLIAPPGSDVNTVAEHSGLVRSFPASDVHGMAAFLEELMCGKTLQPKHPAVYAWENVIQKLDGVLRSAIGQTS
jgi:glycosyltransferase involved in cell wall biosynthesis